MAGHNIDTTNSEQYIEIRNIVYDVFNRVFGTCLHLVMHLCNWKIQYNF